MRPTNDYEGFAVNHNGHEEDKRPWGWDENATYPTKEDEERVDNLHD